jgi:hypothetical protein
MIVIFMVTPGRSSNLLNTLQIFTLIMLHHRSAAKARRTRGNARRCVREWLRRTERQISKRQRYRPMCLYVYPPNVVRQRLGENLTATTNIHAKIEELLDASFYVHWNFFGYLVEVYLLRIEVTRQAISLRRNASDLCHSIHYARLVRQRCQSKTNDLKKPTDITIIASVT